MSNKRWQRDIERLVAPFGWYLVRSKKHLVFRGPAGQQVVVPSSPSDSYRGLLNAKKDFRTHGCPL